jgi:two-component system response regulator FixJ
MGQGETIFLVMADAARRAACFAPLAERPQRIVRGFADARAAREALDDATSGCLVLALDGLGAEAARGLLEAAAAYPALTPVLLADQLDGAMAAALVRAGPGELLASSTGPAALAEQIAAIMPAALARGSAWRDQRAARTALARLSPRENDVLRALAAGQTSKDIARALAVSPRTVEVHRASIMRRTGAASLAALLRLVFLVGDGPATMSKAA